MDHFSIIAHFPWENKGSTFDKKVDIFKIFLILPKVFSSGQQICMHLTTKSVMLGKSAYSYPSREIAMFLTSPKSAKNYVHMRPDVLGGVIFANTPLVSREAGKFF